jgi:hypothetical protein
MNLKNFMLSESSKKYCMITLLLSSWNRETHRHKRIGVTGASGRRESYWFNGAEPVWDDESSGMGGACTMYSLPLHRILEKLRMAHFT